MSPASTEQFLLEQYTGHPASQLQDLRKALYQSVFGCEHLIADTLRRRRGYPEGGRGSRTVQPGDRSAGRSLVPGASGRSGRWSDP